MSYLFRIGVFVSFLWMGAFGAVAALNEQIEETGSMFTYILDTGTSSSMALSPETIKQKSNWTMVPEDGVDYAFKGDAVLLNDQLVVVFRQQSLVAEIYTLAEGVLKPQAKVFPYTKPGIPSRQKSSLRVNECNPGAGTVRIQYSVMGKSVEADYRLTTGQPHVQVVSVEGMQSLRIQTATDFLVVPDFFGDDVVYSANSVRTDIIGLPAENFYVHLTGQGSGIMTCVSEEARRPIRGVVVGEKSDRRIVGSEIDCAEGKSVWLAFAELSDTWFTVDLSPNDTPTDIKLDWTPPYSAKWRGNFVAQGNGIAHSSTFVELQNPVVSSLGLRQNACWFQDSSPMVQLPILGKSSEVPLVVYPIDRTQETPLNRFVLVDIMRGTLGMGPCQYILDLEGLDAQSTPTPALVSEWVESLFKRKRAAKSESKIRERCDDMLVHVAHSEARIEDYQKHAVHLGELIADSEYKGSGLELEITRLLSNLYTSIDTLAPKRKTQDDVERLVASIFELIEEEEWESSMKTIVDDLHGIGHAQDRTLAKCRMSFRLIEQQLKSEPETNDSTTTIMQYIEHIMKSEQSVK